MKNLTFLLLFFIAGNVQAQTRSETRTISVSGEAEIKVVPDEVVVSMAIETKNKNIDEARSENDKRTLAVLDAIKTLGVESKYVQTDYLSVYPTYEQYDEDGRYTAGKKRELFYVMNKTVVVTLKDIKKVETLVTQALKLGVNRIDQVQFRTTQLRKHKDQARLLAVRAAKEKAELMVKELGQTLSRPESISETQDYYYSSPYYRGRADSRTQNSIQNASSEGDAADDGGTISVGMISVKAKVSIVFGLQ